MFAAAPPRGPASPSGLARRAGAGISREPGNSAAGDKLRRGWRADVAGSPLVVGSTVWVVDQEGRATGLDGRTGKHRAQLDVGSATRFAKPAYSAGVLLLPTKAGVTAVRL
jgi:hypothetical protein